MTHIPIPPLGSPISIGGVNTDIAELKKATGIDDLFSLTLPEGGIIYFAGAFWALGGSRLFSRRYAAAAL